MAKSKLEYIWLDGYKPTQSLRSKTKIVEDFDGNVGSAPVCQLHCCVQVHRFPGRWLLESGEPSS